MPHPAQSHMNYSFLLKCLAVASASALLLTFWAAAAPMSLGLVAIFAPLSLILMSGLLITACLKFCCTPNYVVFLQQNPTPWWQGFFNWVFSPSNTYGASHHGHPSQFGAGVFPTASNQHKHPSTASGIGISVATNHVHPTAAGVGVAISTPTPPSTHQVSVSSSPFAFHKLGSASNVSNHPTTAHHPS